MPPEMKMLPAIGLAVLVLGGFSLVAYSALRARAKDARGDGLPGGFWWWLVIGEDGRVSTSKLQVALWSYTVAFALLIIIFINHGLGGTLVLQEQYLLLLGSPAAAAILSKGIVSNRTKEGTLTKPKVAENARKRGALKGFADVVSNDQGQVEIFDLQYLLFTLVAIAAFAFEFFSTSTPKALPNLPWTLVGLTSVSAGGYVGKKLADNQAPVLTAVTPDSAPSEEWVTIRGRNLMISNPDGTDVRPEEVTFGGRTAQIRQGYSTSRIEAKVPRGLQQGKMVTVKVLRSDGIETQGLDFQVTGGPRIVSVQPTRIVFDPNEEGPIWNRSNASDKEIVISGQGFGEVENDNRRAAAVLLDGRPLGLVARNWHPNLIRAKLPSFKEAQREGYAMPGSAELVV